MSSSLVLKSLSNHPNSEKTQISPAYSSAAQSIISSTEGHFPLPFPFPFPFPFPLPLPFPFLALVSTLLEQASIADMAFSPSSEPALHIIIIRSSDRHIPLLSSFSPFPPFPLLPPFPFFARTEAMARESTKTMIRDLMLLWRLW